MSNFANFNKPIEECTDDELLDFYVDFCDDPVDTTSFNKFRKELHNRSQEFRERILLIIDALL